MTQVVDKSNAVPLSFRVDDDLRAKLERIAKANDRTVSAEIRQALRAHVAAELKAA